MSRSRAVCAAALLGIASACGGSQPAQQPQASEPSAAPEWIASFDKVWETVKERHWDPELGGVDWDGVRDELRPKMLQAESLDEARGILEEMLARLGQSHFAILPGDVSSGGGASAGGTGDVGVELRLLDGTPIIYRVDKDSSAAEKGVVPGWTISSIEGEEVGALLGGSASGPHAETAMVRTMQVRRLQTALRGEPGTTVAVAFDTGGEAREEIALERRPMKGTPFQFGHLPTMLLRYESRTISVEEARVGYIYLSAFFDPAMVVPRFAADLKSFGEAGAAGVVIDLRGNPGGIGAMAMGMSGYLVAESNQILGTMKTREGDLRFTINPQAYTFSGQIAVLIDEMSMSTTEILAAGLRDIGRARLFGSRSGGAALPSVVEVLPSGDAFQFAVADYVSSSGARLEGEGVEPDVSAPLRRDELLAGRDPALEAAKAWILDR